MQLTTFTLLALFSLSVYAAVTSSHSPANNIEAAAPKDPYNAQLNPRGPPGGKQTYSTADLWVHLSSLYASASNTTNRKGDDLKVYNYMIKGKTCDLSEIAAQTGISRGKVERIVSRLKTMFAQIKAMC